ncbi:MAG TPA: sulfotransferase [Longimicrobium sp.]
MTDAAGATDPVLLVGAQRSGTTALALRLNEAFRDAGGLFTVNGKLPYYLRRWWGDPAAHRHLRADEVIHGLRRKPPFGPDADAFLARAEEALRRDAARCAAAGGGDGGGGLEGMRRLCREAYGVPRWGDKYNEYLLELDHLHALFPRATWIFLARDPSEVVASLLDWPGDRPWNPRDAGAAALKWAAWNGEWLRFRERVEPARRVELLYGDVAAGRRGALDDCLGLDLGPYMEGFFPRPRTGPPRLPPEAERTWARLAEICNPR